MKNVFKYIEENKTETVGFLKKLISVATVNPPGDKYEKICDIICQKCGSLGLDVKKINVPKKILKQNKITADNKRVCVLAQWNVNAEKTLHINGHYDVVPALAKRWKSDPFSAVFKHARIYGRGTEDMKGNIASYLSAVAALKKFNIKPSCNLQFSFTPDEETGGETGFGYLVANDMIKADYAIGEGYSGPYLSVGNKGVLWMKVDIKGLSAHSSKPYKGVNSFERMVAVCSELMKLSKKISRRKTAYCTRDARDRYSSMVLGGKSWGGEKVNIVPDLSGFTIDRRFLPEENKFEVKKEIMDCLKSIKKKLKDLKIETDILIEQDCAVSVDNKEFFNVFDKALKTILRKTPRHGIMAGATDMRFLIKRQIPCLGYSVDGGGRCHAADEYVTIKSLLDTAKVFSFVFIKLNFNRR